MMHCVGQTIVILCCYGSPAIGFKHGSRDLDCLVDANLFMPTHHYKYL